MGVAVTGIDSKKLQTHINFIAETHKKARVSPLPFPATPTPTRPQPCPQSQRQCMHGLSAAAAGPGAGRTQSTVPATTPPRLVLGAVGRPHSFEWQPTPPEASAHTDMH